MGETCFIISPISTPPSLIERYGGDTDHFLHVIEHLLVPAAEAAGFEPLSPIARGSDLIHSEIVRQLESSAMVLCDMSTLNANVFFELGIRTAVDKPFCLVHDPFVGTLPFDTGLLNAMAYDATLAPWVLPAEVERLAAHLQDSAQRSGGRNPMWRYFGLTTRGSMEAADRSTVEEKLDFLIAELGNRDVRHDVGEGVARAAEETRRLRWVLRLSESATGRIWAPTEVEAALAFLSPQAKDVLALRYGLYSGRTLPIGSVAPLLDLSVEEATAQELKGMRILRIELMGTNA